jgi:hypothetical protein
MIPIKTSWTNVIMGEGQDHVLPCPAHRDPKTGEVIVAFELTDEEVQAVIKTRTVLLKQCTYNQPMQPIQLWVNDENGQYVKDDRI